ncbi:tRNA(Ile)-lysidine synthase [Halolactibacillus alkaliphilus]|uniref:tRNA(Ile)-lysidine synthase n=1 Tax=Halolactibacillus alkaliphilus TaxID=442899 RepID=A0A511X4T2_9BACI|nr:tRNA lysidine(34) synthetase TilS [Halolactibacillus alkaliphilus]GEN57957.1 tRNA(Ile)-lysidine synthase [Halolactibacillus alkaliphilus]GGN75938.1 tRNA(Ile)-lysidine synthase [Halolactibacillus alkaliphilus]SFP09490.1 tRNA(Ile)-lysidine synthase [Halolactibacillus alkaliphilus]
MLNKIEKYITEKKLLVKGERVLLAVSGGADSMAMLDAFTHLALPMELSLVVATIDHQLRGEESKLDRAFVENYCHARHITVVGRDVDVSLYKKTHRVGTQVAAREMRYQVLKEIMHTQKCDSLVLAHHADDQVESLLMQIVRSTDPRALMGIPVTRPFEGKRLIRPMLAVSKEEIYNYLKKRHVPFREDPSNQEDRYRRNAIRHHIIPKLKQFNPELLKTTEVLLSHLKEDDDYLNQEALKRFDCLAEKDALKRTILIETQEIKKEARALQRRLFHLILNYLYDTLPSSLSYKHETAFFSLLQHTEGNRSVDLPEGLVMRQVYHRLMFSFKNGNAYEEAVNHKKDRLYPLVASVVDEQGEVTKDCLYLPVDQYESGAYHIRTRKPGDSVYIPHIDGHKKVSRIFIDKKIPQHKRDTWPLMVNQEDAVVWVLGITKPFLNTHVKAKQYVKLTYQKKHS